MPLKESKKVVGISSLYNLKMHIIVLGYKKMGESILIMFEDTAKSRAERIVYSVVVDSYCFRKGHKCINITDEYLRKYKVGRNLSVAIWTHPHLDHSRGLKHILGKYSTTNTKVISSPYFYNQKDDIVAVRGQENVDVVKSVFSMSRFKNGYIYRPSVMKESYAPIDEIVFKGFDEDLNVSLDAIAPCLGILDDFKFRGVKGLNPNEISIAFILNINEHYFLFAGDTINRHIDKVNSNCLNNCVFVKIPHHASLTSNSLIGYLNKDVLETACVTRFKAGPSNLPDKTVIQEYLLLTDNVFSTGDETHENSDYGIIEYEYSFPKGGDYEVSIELKGNSYQCV